MTGQEYHDKVLKTTAAGRMALDMAPAVDCPAYRHVALAVGANLDCHDAHAAFYSNGFGKQVAKIVAAEIEETIQNTLLRLGVNGAQDQPMPELRIGKWIAIKGMKTRDIVRLMILGIVFVMMIGLGYAILNIDGLREAIESMKTNHIEDVIQ